ncbi:Protein of unknown function DUF2143 [Methanothermus fervidus DSM 2088]|uniref:Yip1 domain-containing protein n=1 Tax=Methanothermus fervidus (strain ATCC 43054 / DSM 2088 / JCM 10308 / V24 S) TaxID=523846 RepID=E3GWX9_METFV|nr:YIP1 family protein [Methanothermus fervidus]ADP76868.1 Protein of unknown function DUF2143 [Methanothermus fervidus DSM 2088]
MKRIMDFSEELLDILVYPRDTLKTMKQKGKDDHGLIIYLFMFAFLGFMFGGILSRLTGVVIIFQIFFALVFLILGFLILLIWSLISHTVAVFCFGGKGKFDDTLKFLGFSAAPYILGIFAITIIIVFKAFFTSTLLFALMYLWSLFIATVAIDTVHNIGLGKSFLSVFGVPILVISMITMFVEALLWI